MHAILAVLILAQAVSAPKQAWEYTDEERFAMRFDPVSMRERAEASARERGRKVELDSIAAGDVPNVVVGNRNPELFLPFELFNFLVEDAFSSDQERRQSTRKRLNAFVSAAPDVFWSALEQSTAEFTANQAEERELIARLNEGTSVAERRAIEARLEVIQPIQCGLRYEALQRAEKAVGRENLYRVLYQGIAPGVATTASEPNLFERFAFIRRGCK